MLLVVGRVGLWRVSFQGTDITEAFESHHIGTAPQLVLKRFFVREASAPRNSPFTFKEGDFYKALKGNVREALKAIPDGPVDRSKLTTDLLLVGYLSTAILAARFWSYTLGAISGLLLALMAIAAHNFFHQRNNFRMYYFNFSLMHYK